MSINTSRGRTSNTRPFTILPSLNSRDGDRASSSFMSVMDCVLHLGLPFDLRAGQPTLDANHREGRRKVGTAERKASNNSSRGTDVERAEKQSGNQEARTGTSRLSEEAFRRDHLLRFANPVDE